MLTPELRDLLEAQIEASEELPYGLFGVKRPKLSQIYVRQTVRRRAVERRESDRREAEDHVVEEVVERVMTVAEALDGNQHLVITGDAGAGKSTAGYAFVKSLCEHWLHGSVSPLREPVVPVRIPARALVAPEAWSTVLANGAREALGQFLNAEPEPALFAQRALGARWMVFIDGLDEIADDATTDQIVRTIVRKARRGTDHRLVITTRRLDEKLMDQLAEAEIASFNLEPFGQEQLVGFAEAWFRAQDPVTAPERAREFVRQTADGQLRELVRNPLLVTIAAITFTRDPSRPLPANRVDLYAGFMTSLLDEQASGRNIVAELRRVLVDRPERLRLAEWLGEHRSTLIRHLAVQRLSTELPLFDAAREWVTSRRADLPDGWPEDLRAVLVDSGVFARSGDALGFLHHSFAEFLAAERYAEEIPADFQDLDEWIERGRRRADQVMVLFTLVLWSRRPGHDVAPVVRRLLDGEADGVELAGRLLAEGCAVPDELAAEVVDRIVSLVVLGESEFGELLGSVGGRVAGELHELVDNADLPIVARVECAIALGRLADPEFGARKLEALGPLVDDYAVRRLARGLAELVPSGADRAERLLVELITPVPMTDLFPAVVEALLELRRVEAVASVVRELVRNARSDQPAGHAWWESAEDCSTIAGIALRCGCRDEAVWAARRSLADLGADDIDLAAAAGVVLSVFDAEGVAEVLTAVTRHPPEHRAKVALSLVGEHPELARTIARTVVDDQAAALTQVLQAGAILVADAGVEVVEELADLLDREPAALGEHWQQLADVASDNGHSAEAQRLARRVLGDPSSDRWDFSAAAALLLEHRVDPEEIRVAARTRPFDWQVEAVEALCKAGKGPVAAELTKDLLGGRVEEVDNLAGLVNHLVTAGEREAGEQVLAAVRRLADRSSASELAGVAGALMWLGRKEEAVEAAREAVVVDYGSNRPAGSPVEYWLDAAGASGAADITAQVLPSRAMAPLRVRIATALARKGFLTQAVALWLDVLTREDTKPDVRFEVAAKLVACGRRAEAIAALRGSDRQELRALLGWVFLSSSGADPAELLSLLRP
jgi:tetratricopeptide (TPR) repeat protein